MWLNLIEFDCLINLWLYELKIVLQSTAQLYFQPVLELIEREIKMAVPYE